MDYEVKILNNIPAVKKELQSVVNNYQEDFLLEEIVFITIDDLSKLDHLSSQIEIREEQYAEQ